MIQQFTADRHRRLFDIKELRERFSDLFSEAQLCRIVLLEPGTRLESGSLYLRLNCVYPQLRMAHGDEAIRGDEWCVAKESTPAVLWNRLVGVQNPEPMSSR